MAQNKITQRDFITMALELMGKADGVSQEMLDKGADMLKALDRKKSGSGERKPTKTQEENEVLKGVIVEVLSASEEPLSIKEIKARDERLAQFEGSQKISSLLTQLRKANVVERIESGKDVKFAIVDEGEGVEE